jgi:transcriptional regulator with XRE-family HTH domain
MRNASFSPVELGKRLRQLRLRAQLTQDEAAERMGLTGTGRRKTVERLERGRNRNPLLDTVLRFLRACGAGWGDIADVLEDAPGSETNLKPLADSGFEASVQKRVAAGVERQVRRYELKLARPAEGRPLHPEQRQEAVRKLRNYRLVIGIIEQAVNEHLKEEDLTTVVYPALKAVAREAVGVLWRRQKAEAGRQNGRGDTSNAACADAVTAELARRVEYWVMKKLDPGMVRAAQAVAVNRFNALREMNPELFPSDR